MASRLQSARHRFRFHTHLFWAVVLSLIVTLGIAGSALWFVPYLFHVKVSSEDIAAKDLTALALTIAAGLGAVVALVVAYRHQRDLEKGRFVESFGAAATQLGDQDVAVRFAGVYAMAGVADESQGSKRQQCVDVLCAYLRIPYVPDYGKNHLQQRKQVTLMETGTEERLYQYRENDREVRWAVVRLIKAHLHPTAEYSWSSCSFDFRNVVFESANFDNSVFAGRYSSFHGALFTGLTTSFENVSFKGEEAGFVQATFRGTDFTFKNVAFKTTKVIRFDGAKFETHSKAGDGTRYGGTFEGAEFGGAGTAFYGCRWGNQDVPVSFEKPKRWDPAPCFDWDDDISRKPANVQPDRWPPDPGHA